MLSFAKESISESIQIKETVDTKFMSCITSLIIDHGMFSWTYRQTDKLVD